MLVFGSAACGSDDGGPDDPGPYDPGDTTPTTAAAAYLSQGDFHALGETVLAGFFDRGQSAASFLRVDQTSVDLYSSGVCFGSRSSYPKPKILPSDVPGFEKIFLRVSLTCDIMTEERLGAERARVAASMRTNQFARLGLITDTQTSTFCSSFEKFKPITAFVLSAALKKIGVVDDDTAGLVGLGVDLINKNCSQWAPQLDLE